MSKLTTNEAFLLDASPARVWEYLLDPERIVLCLPGAELTGQDDERTFRGTVRVKVGSLSITYRGRIVFEEIDEASKTVRLVGKGSEKSGSGTVGMTMTSQVLEAEGGGSLLSVISEVRLTGKIVRFGRGMLQSVSAEILSTFIERFAASMAEDGPTGAALSADQDSSSTSEEPKTLNPSVNDTVREGAGAASETPTGTADSVEELSVGSLLLRALRRWFGGLFSRSRGKGRAGPE